jgi:UDP-N-acetylmuramoyl-tripeptide--D-alanyl-D-alanine ligase
VQCTANLTKSSTSSKSIWFALSYRSKEEIRLNHPKKLLSLTELVAASDGRLVLPDPARNNLSSQNDSSRAEALSHNNGENGTLTFTKVVYDSRQVEQGVLFVALPGETTDGHNYISNAIEKGAAACLVSESWWQLQTGSYAVPLVVVPDTLKAFQATARWWRSQYPNLKVIGVTGSVGKTSTKELIAAVLAQRFKVFKSPKSFNNETSLMPVLLELQPEDEIAVIELGEAFLFEEISRVCAIVDPIVGVVTNVSHSHFERMGSLANIAKSIAELPQALPASGMLFLNGDDGRVAAMAKLSSAKVAFYGTNPDFALWADDIQTFGLDGIAFTVRKGAEKRNLRLNLLARHNVYTAMAAISVGLHFGLTWEEIERGLLDPDAVLRLVTLPGLNGSTIIDDRYNASAVSMVAALGLMEDTKASGRKIGVLGDIYELGDYTQEAHEIVGRKATEVLDVLLAVGDLGAIIGKTALEAGFPADKVLFVDKTGATAWLEQNMQSGDLVLIKASRGMALEEVVEKVRAVYA